MRVCEVRRCERPHEARGMCVAHYNRWRKHGVVMESRPLVPRFDPVARFWAKVRKTRGCWLWTASRMRSGHGMFRWASQMSTAHRFSWELHNGPIPAGQFVLHRCGNAPCVRPDHLYLGTQLDNMVDRDRHGRTAIGEQNGKSRLTVRLATEIRRRYEAGGISMRALGREYGVAYTTIRAAVRGWTYQS